MIAYDLQCINEHCFEGWFEDENAYLEQEKNGLIVCPLCNAAEVKRIPSRFVIKSSSTALQTPQEATSAELVELGRRVVDFVQKNFDDVGCNFAREALKIHYGVNPPRNIRGTSTTEEEKTLEKEGIEYFKLPLPPNFDADA
jgi:hypothetical protein